MKLRGKSLQTSGREEECEGNTLPTLYMRTYMVPETTLKSREYLVVLVEVIFYFSARGSGLSPINEPSAVADRN